MHTARSKPDACTVLRKIAEKNQPPEIGNGIPENHFVPACKVHSRAVAIELVGKLSAVGIESRAKHHRLWTHLSVHPSDLERTLQLKDELMKSSPDAPLRPMSRDYDVFFLFTPFLLLAAVMSFFFGRFVFVGVLTSGFSAMLFFERFHRHYRYRAATAFRISELFLLTTLCAVNLTVWLAII